MSRKKKTQMPQEANPRNRESHKQKEILPDAPATSRQRELLRLAVQREWLHPNPFVCDHAKWKNLTAGEADQHLASLPRERLGILERELNEEQRRRTDHGIARAIGRGLEDVTRQLGHSIDGGIS